MLSSVEIKALGRQIAAAMLIGRKFNAGGVAKAAGKFRKAGSFFKLNSGRVMSEKQLVGAGIGKKLIVEFSKPQYGPLLSKRGRKWLVRPTMGETVRLHYHPANWPLAREVILACCRRGAHVTWIPTDSAIDRDAVGVSSVESLEDYPPIAEATINRIDATISIESEDDPAWKKGLPVSKLAAGMQNRVRIGQIFDRRRVKWLYVGWPFALTARRLGVKPAWFEKMLFDSLKESFSPRTKKLVNYYAAALKGADEVKITHPDGTNLRFSVKGRKVLKDEGLITPEALANGDVGLNIPSGEAFVSPLEQSAEGVIRFDKVMVHGHGQAEGLKLVFKKGKVVDFSAKKGREKFAAYLKENTPSTRTIAELGIGCNPAAKYSGYILTDEKIAGTLHIAIGNNTGSYGGKNEASGHLDMVKDMTKGVMAVDGKPVMRAGKPVS